MVKPIVKKIKSRLQKLKKPSKKIQEFIKVAFWVLGIYTGINLLPTVNSLLLKLPSGLFLIFLTNLILMFYFSVKTYFDFLAVKICLNKRDSQKLLINAIYTINQSLYIGFNIYILLCLINSH